MVAILVASDSKSYNNRTLNKYFLTVSLTSIHWFMRCSAPTTDTQKWTKTFELLQVDDIDVNSDLCLQLQHPLPCFPQLGLSLSFTKPHAHQLVLQLTQGVLLGAVLPATSNARQVALQRHFNSVGKQSMACACSICSLFELSCQPADMWLTCQCSSRSLTCCLSSFNPVIASASLSFTPISSSCNRATLVSSGNEEFL